MKYKIFLYLINIIGSYAVYAQSALVGYYPFNGNAKDLSGKNHHGIIEGCSLVCDRFGNENSAYYFNGQSYITIEDHKDFLFNASDSMSVTAWVKFSTNQPDFAGIIVKGPIDINRPGFQLVILDGNKPSAETTIPDNDFVRLITSEKLELCDWHFLTVTVSTKQSKIDLFVDGQLVGYISNPNIDISYNNNFPIYIGKDRNSVRYFTGVIDDVRIYRSVLSEYEINRLYHENNWPQSSRTCGEQFVHTVRRLCNSTVLLQSNRLIPPFIWSTGEKTPSISVNKDGKFWVEGTGSDGCSSIDSFLVINEFSSNISAGSDQTICMGDTVQLTATPLLSNDIIEYQWYSIPKKIIGNNSNISVSPHQTTEYFVVAKSKNDCLSLDTVKIIVNAQQTLNTQIGSIINAYPGALISIPVTFANSYIEKPIHKLKCVIKFKPNCFVFEQKNIQGTVFEGWNVLNEKRYKDSITFELYSSNAGLIVNQFELAMTISLRAYISDAIVYPISVEFYPLDMVSCTKFLSTPGSVSIDTTICGLQSRLIEMSENQNFIKLKENIIQDYLNFTYSHSFEEVVEIYLVNLSGSIIKKIIQEKQKEGVYQQICYTGNLPNGIYYCIMNIDKKTQVTPFVISH